MKLRVSFVRRALGRVLRNVQLRHQAVALLQSTAEQMDVSANLAKSIDLCRRAKEMGADIALFPEMWSIGYSFPDATSERSVKRWKECAVGARSVFLTRFGELAAELSMAIAVTYLQKWAVSPRNVVSIIDRHGVVALEYAKVHTCDFDVESFLTPGGSFPVALLDTRIGLDSRKVREPFRRSNSER